MVGGRLLVWSVVGCVLVGGRLLFLSVVGVFHSHWSVVDGRLLFWSVFSQPLVGGRWFLRSVVGGRLFLRKWSVVGGSVTVVGGWSVGGVFVLRRTF